MFPPAEMAVHYSSDSFVQHHAEHQLLRAVLYLMRDDLRSLIRSLETKHVVCTPVREAEWGI